MNLDNAPTKEELRQLLAPCNDRAGNHILWVNKAGDVHLARVAPDSPALGFEQTHPDLQLRYETFERGNEYVGPAAAGDDAWVSELFDSLLKEWTQARGKREPGYVRLW